MCREKTNGRECCFSRLSSTPAVRGGYTSSPGRLDFNVAQRGVILCKSTAVEFSRVHKWNQRSQMNFPPPQYHKIFALWLMLIGQESLCTVHCALCTVHCALSTVHCPLCTVHCLLSRRLVVPALPHI